MHIVTCKKIRKTYKHGFLSNKIKNALQGIDLTISEKEIFGIIGPNGAGKSTLFKILMGFTSQTSGEANVFNQNANIAKCHDRIGYLPENPSLFWNLTVLDHLFMACRLAKLTKKQSLLLIDSALDRVNLTESGRIPLRKFSKGMVQRAALANAIILKPDLLILDEPMSGLDPMGRHMVMDLILDCNKSGATVLFSSHILTDVERICDRIGVLHDGHLAATIYPKDIGINSAELFTKSGSTPLESYFLKIIGY